VHGRHAQFWNCNTGRRLDMRRAVMGVAIVVIIGASMGQVFAVDACKPDPLPDGIKGFRGMMIGTIVSKGDSELVLKVEKITRTWKQNKAEKPGEAVGKKLLLEISSKKWGRLAGKHRKTLRGLKVGDRVVVEPFHFGGDRLTVVEALHKAEGEKE